jgi:hypothetical protein
MMSTNGSSAEPAAVGEYPWIWIILKGRKNNAPLRLAYSSSVSRLAPLKVRARNSPSGSIGSAILDSTTRKATTATAPRTSAARTTG